MTTATRNDLASTQYEMLLIQLAQAMKAGNREWANFCRREMELPERDLDETMLDRFDGLSADLYMLEDKEYFERIDPTLATPNHLGRDLKTAWENEDWEQVLTLLRKDAPFISQEQRAYLRAIAYKNLGQLRSAFVFMDHAARQNPTDVVYRYLCLDYLVRLGENQEALRRAKTYIADETTPPALLIKSASVLVQTARHAKETTAKEQALAAIPALVRALSSKADLDFSPSEVIALGYVSLGLSLELVGDTEKANSAYQLALVVEPENGVAQEALRERLSSQKKSTPFNITIPSGASEAVPSNTSFQTLRAQQIWLATGSE